MSFQSRKKLRIGLIFTLILIASVALLGPILYVITAKPSNIEGPTVRSRTY